MFFDIHHPCHSPDLIHGIITVLLGIITGHNFTLNERTEKGIDDVPFNLTGSGMLQEVTSFDL
jgi:hypothetical protein